MTTDDVEYLRQTLGPTLKKLEDQVSAIKRRRRDVRIFLTNYLTTLKTLLQEYPLLEDIAPHYNEIVGELHIKTTKDTLIIEDVSNHEKARVMVSVFDNHGKMWTCVTYDLHDVHKELTGLLILALEKDLARA